MKWNAEKIPDQRLCGYLRVTLDGREVDCVAFDTDRGTVELISEPARVENRTIVTEIYSGVVGAELLPNATDEMRQIFETLSATRHTAPREAGYGRALGGFLVDIAIGADGAEWCPLDQARKAIEIVENDAARYRYLRNRDTYLPEAVAFVLEAQTLDFTTVEENGGRELDEAIDQEILKQKGKNDAERNG